MAQLLGADLKDVEPLMGCFLNSRLDKYTAATVYCTLCTDMLPTAPQEKRSAVPQSLFRRLQSAHSTRSITHPTASGQSCFLPQPVARLKLKDWVSVQAVPRAQLKVSKTLPLARTGMAVKLLYECPLDRLDTFWQPPARLMVRCAAVLYGIHHLFLSLSRLSHHILHSVPRSIGLAVWQQPADIQTRCINSFRSVKQKCYVLSGEGG